MDHFIAKQRIDLQLKHTSRAKDIQEEISRLYYRDIVPQLEKLFDQLAGERELIRVESLEVNLGKISQRDLEQKTFLPRLLQEMEALLQDLLQRPSETVTRIPIARSLFERWLFFLEHGFLPWEAEQLRGNWKESVLATLGLKDQAIHSFRRLMARSRAAWERLQKQHRPEFLIAIAELCTAGKQKDLASAMEVIWRLHPHSVGEMKKSPPLDTRKEESPPSEADLIDQLIHGQIALPGLDIQCEGKQITNGAYAGTDLEKYDYYIHRAGIVLLNPFLPTFFRKMGLVEAEDFRDEPERERAIYLLHFLAGGETSVPEYELVLPKLLCNWPLDMPLEREIQLTELELAEADNLLQAAIEHWGALGAVSSEALRQSFLRRSGKMSRRDNGWLLQVEQHAIDLLLDKLPWGIGMIKLPWMKQMLHVEWGS